MLPAHEHALVFLYILTFFSISFRFPEHASRYGAIKDDPASFCMQKTLKSGRLNAFKQQRRNS